MDALSQLSKSYLQRDLGYPESHEHQQARLVQDVQIDHLCQQGQKDQQDPIEEGYQALVNEENSTGDSSLGLIAWTIL